MTNVVNTGSGANVVSMGTADTLQRSEAPGYDDILTTTVAESTYVAQTDATGYDDILTNTAAEAAYLALDAFPLRAQRATLANTDTTAKDLFTLPLGAILLGFVVNVSTNFDDSGTDLIDIGDGTTADRFVADLDASSAGISLVASADEAALSADTLVKGVYTGQNGNSSQGAATITALYIVPTS